MPKITFVLWDAKSDDLKEFAATIQKTKKLINDDQATLSILTEDIIQKNITTLLKKEKEKEKISTEPKSDEITTEGEVTEEAYDDKSISPEEELMWSPGIYCLISNFGSYEKFKNLVDAKATTASVCINYNPPADHFTVTLFDNGLGLKDFFEKKDLFNTLKDTIEKKRAEFKDKEGGFPYKNIMIKFNPETSEFEYDRHSKTSSHKVDLKEEGAAGGRGLGLRADARIMEAVEGEFILMDTQELQKSQQYLEMTGLTSAELPTHGTALIYKSPLCSQFLFDDLSRHEAMHDSEKSSRPEVDYARFLAGKLRQELRQQQSEDVIPGTLDLSKLKDKATPPSSTEASPATSQPGSRSTSQPVSRRPSVGVGIIMLPDEESKSGKSKRPSRAQSVASSPHPPRKGSVASIPEGESRRRPSIFSEKTGTETEEQTSSNTGAPKVITKPIKKS